MEEPVLNAHNKEEYPPKHMTEHILNGTMVRLFGCPRSRNAHIERTVNEVIARNLDVTIDVRP